MPKSCVGFARMVAGAEVRFLHFTYSDLLETFVTSHSQDVRDHAERLRARFAIA
jgi:ATP-dependent Zn protease